MGISEQARKELYILYQGQRRPFRKGGETYTDGVYTKEALDELMTSGLANEVEPETRRYYVEITEAGRAVVEDLQAEIESMRGEL